MALRLIPKLFSRLLRPIVPKMAILISLLRCLPLPAMLPMLLTVSPPKASTCNLVCYWLIFRDAVALAQNRLPEGHPHLVNLYLAYARHLLHAKSTEEACRWFILGKDIGSAIDAIASRNTRDSLLAALELSLKNNHETYPLRIWRYSVACQVEGAHGEAALALFNLPPSLPVVASLIFTLTDGSYIYTNDTPVENEDVIDLEDFESDNDSSATVTSHFFVSSFRISNRSFRCGPNLACRSLESATCFTKERTTP
ncbi:Gem-associated protein 5 [Entomophthora muscae]|uniref:Gem-associated protein 5 n=1 Tax=Entomophthora muscae TaxID=34485 RepID=A0ACC2SPF4_9FUNG|nr:Gem-associated protein 5 [Entomophthora muscae]